MELDIKITSLLFCLNSHDGFKKYIISRFPHMHINFYCQLPSTTKKGDKIIQNEYQENKCTQGS